MRTKRARQMAAKEILGLLTPIALADALDDVLRGFPSLASPPECEALFGAIQQYCREQAKASPAKIATLHCLSRGGLSEADVPASLEQEFLNVVAFVKRRAGAAAS